MKTRCSYFLKAFTSLVLVVLLIFSSVATVIGVQWMGGKRIYFCIPTTWTSSFSHVYVAAMQSNNYNVIICELSEVSPGSGIYGNTDSPSLDHGSNWGNEYIYVFATNTKYNDGSARSGLPTKLYDTGVNTDVNVSVMNNSANTYFLYATKDKTTGTGLGYQWTNYDNFGYLDATASPHFKQSVSSSTGGSSVISGYRVKNQNTSFESTSATDGDIYAFVGSKVTVTATASTGYDFDGFYSDSSYTTPITTGVTNNVYTYSISSTTAKTVYAKFVQSAPSIKTFTSGETTLNLGETTTLSSTTLNTSGSETVTYSVKSGSESLVSVSGSNTVKALAPGTATLVATLTDGAYTDTAELNITVNTPEIDTFKYGTGTNDGTESAKAYPIYAGTTSIAPTMAVRNTNASATVTYAYTIGDSTYGTVASDGKITAKTTPNASQTVSATATITYNDVSYTTAAETAYYKVYAYYLMGFKGKVSNPWDKIAANMMTPDTDSGWFTINRTLSGGSTTYGSGSSSSSDTGFKVEYYDGTTTTYYSNSGTVTATITKDTLNGNSYTWVYANSVSNNARLTTKDCSTTDAVYKFYFKESTKQLAVYYPVKITYNKNGGNTTQYEAVAYGDHANAPATNPTKSGYSFVGWTTTANGNTNFDFTSARTADATAYAKWSEDTVSVAVKAFTADSESTTGGTVSPTSVTVGIDTSVSSVATAEAASGYIFNGWQIVGSHINLYTDAECNTAYVAGDRTHTTVYIKTDGTKPLGSENYVRANFVYGARTYVVGQMVKDDAGNYTIAKASASSNTSDGFNATTTIANSGNVLMYGTASMSTTGNINGTDTQNPTVNFTGAVNNGGNYEFTYVKYQFMGWKKSDTPLTEVSGSNDTWDATNASITTEVPSSGEGYWYACYRKQYVFCAFRSYNYDAGVSGNIIFIASPPTQYRIGSNAAVGYTEQGAKIAVPAGEDLKLKYTSLASSDCIDHVYYDDTDYTTATPSAENFNSSNQHEISTGISTDQSAHEVTISMTQNYKNIHIALGMKYKIFFSDYKNATIHSKNVDNYYAPGEAVSGDTSDKYLTVKATGNANQTNTITSTSVKFYYCDSTGEFTNASGVKVDEPVEITGTDLAFEAGDSVNTGATDGTARKITGSMPNTNVYVDLGLDTTYDFYIGSKIVSDTVQKRVAWRQVAGIDLKYKPDDTEFNFSATKNDATSEKATWDSGAVTAVKQGKSVKLSWEYWDISSGSGEAYSTKYMFVGWYKGNSTGPFYESKNLLSEKKVFSYTPKANVYVWAVGTRDLYINGTASITGDNNGTSWSSTNFKMKFDPDYVNPEGGAQGRYYWEITETMLNGTSDPGKLTGLHNDSNGVWIPGGLESQNTEGWDRAVSNSYFRIYDSATITDSDSDGKYYDETANLSYWTSIKNQNNNKTDLNWGKALDGNSAGDNQKTLGLGYINYNSTTYPAYSAPIRIYAYPGHGIDVNATPVYSNLYISNGFTVGSTSKDTAVTVQPVKNGAVATGGDAFTITNVDTYTGSNEGTVTHYKPEMKNATVRITKTCTATEKVSAFFVYDIDNDKVYSLKDVQNSSNDWYIDLTVKLQQNLYIVPIIEETSANVTVNFDATQLNKTQWGDIVTCYAWYTSGGGDALGAFPGQPMIVSDDLGSWTAKFPESKTVSGTTYNIAGITFSNYVDGNQSWLGRTSTTGRKPVMSTVTYSNSSVSGGVGSILSVADDGLIKQYNKIESGNNSEYSRQNFKAQTYDYREPIAIFKNRDTSAGTDTTITFAMKDGNSSLLSWRHAELLHNNIINLPEGWSKLNWEYLSNSTGNKYSDLNGQPLEGKPTATYYIAAKGGYVYNNGNVTAAFYSGKSYDTANHSFVNTDYYNKANDNVYAQDGPPVASYASDGTPTYKNYNNYGWVHDGCDSTVSYGDSSNTSADPNDIDFDYAVQWYVYDASGQYITTVLSSAFADMNTAKTQTYITRELLNKGYAVDGKAVAICYDKPRYYYWDDSKVPNGASKGSGSGNVNSGEGFAGYRFTGQWYTTVKTEPVTVDVKVGMMTESGEIMADTNSMPYGNATASFSTANGTAAYAHSSDGTRSVTVALADAEKRLVKLDADPTNFIGWYYYDSNTGELEKASYDSNANFFPNFNKDVTYYAMYSAAATYRYKYQGREGAQYYSVAGGDLTETELEDNKIRWGVGQRTTIGSGDGVGKYDIKKLAPGSDKIGVFKKDINFSSLDYTAAGTYDTSKDYTLDIGPFTNTVSNFTLTYYYYNNKGDGSMTSHSQSFAYNTTVDMQGDVATAAVNNAPEGKVFAGWYLYDGTNYGALLTEQPNYGFVMTKEMTIAAKYDDAKEVDDSTWRAFIDDNVVNKELNTDTSGRYYNDTIIRFRKGTNAATAVPNGTEVGVIIINDGKSGSTIVTNENKIKAFVNGLNNEQTGTIGTSGRTVTKLCKTIGSDEGQIKLSYYNRCDFALRSDYSTTKTSKYTVYAYAKFTDGTWAISSATTGESCVYN